MSASNGRATGKTARFDAARTKRLRRAYNAGYAKYLLEYLEGRFK